MKKKNIYKENLFCVLSVILLVIFGTLITFKSENVKANIYDKIYNNHISFAEIKKVIVNNVGSIIPFQDILKEEPVFDEKIRYNNISSYDNGVKLYLENNYSIPILNDGIVIFIGEKDNLGKTVIIEDENGVDTYYGNLDNVNVKIYDYVSKNQYLGTAKDNSLYLLFEKENKYLDYKEFLK